MKKIFSLIGIALLMASCTEDYKDWAKPFSNDPEEAFNVGFTASPASPIDFATVEADKVLLFNSTIDAPEGATAQYTAYITDESGENKSEALTVSDEGYVDVDELESAVYALWGRRPLARIIPLVVGANISVNGTAFAKESITTLTATPDAPEIEEAYYITGTPNGWDNNDTSLELTNGGGDVYENPVFTVLIPSTGSDIEFKVTPKSGIGGDWSKCLTASDTEGKFATNNAGGNLKVAHVEGAKFYRVTFNMLDQTWKSDALNFAQFVYFIGATDGWSKAEQKLESPNFDGVYTGFVYCADPNGWGNEFKFQRVAGSWENEINSGTFTGGITGDFADGGGNIKATAGEGVYYVKLDLANLTLNATFINNMNLVGDFNGWNAADDAQQMTWNATDYCWEITGAGVNANGWKFTSNNSWDINLGGTIANLVANGDNLSVVGTTIKLYPTRKTSDKIYCTVE